MSAQISTSGCDARPWLKLLDEAGAGYLAPEPCRENLLKADTLMSPFHPQALHFAEFPLLGEPCFDMTWGVAPTDMAHATQVQPELIGAQTLAHSMAEDSIFFVEYDTSALVLPAAGFYFKGLLNDGGHPMREMMVAIGRPEEARPALVAAARLAKLGYLTQMCGVMAGRPGAPVRITAKPVGDFDLIRLMSDLALMGFHSFTCEMRQQIEELIVPNEYLFGAPLVYLDVLSDGSLGPTLGLEFSGIRAQNAESYPQLTLAQEWGLADNRWKALVGADAQSQEDVVLRLNTLKFRWREGESLPAKLYTKALW